MKKATEYIGVKAKRKPRGLSKRYKAMLIEWAAEAHRLDPSNPMNHYYNLFLNRLRQKYLDKNLKSKFFEHGVIDV